MCISMEGVLIEREKELKTKSSFNHLIQMLLAFVVFFFIFDAVAFAEIEPVNLINNITGIYVENRTIRGREPEVSCLVYILKEGDNLRMNLQLWEGEIDISKPYRDADVTFDGYAQTDITTLDENRLKHEVVFRDSSGAETKALFERVHAGFINTPLFINPNLSGFGEHGIYFEKIQEFIEPFEVLEVMGNPYGKGPKAFRVNWNIQQASFVFQLLSKDVKTGDFSFVFLDNEGQEITIPCAKKEWLINYDHRLGMDFTQMYENPPVPGSSLSCWFQEFAIHDPYTGQTTTSTYVVRCR